MFERNTFPVPYFQFDRLNTYSYSVVLESMLNGKVSSDQIFTTGSVRIRGTGNAAAMKEAQDLDAIQTLEYAEDAGESSAESPRFPTGKILQKLLSSIRNYKRIPPER